MAEDRANGKFLDDNQLSLSLLASTLSNNIILRITPLRHKKYIIYPLIDKTLLACCAFEPT
jgi:hypothetical protein